MKKIKLLIAVILLTFLIQASLKANPITPSYFSEIMFDSKGWTIELSTDFMRLDTLIKWRLSSGSGIANLKDTIYRVNQWFVVLTSDSLQGRLNINPEGDSIFLYAGEFVVDKFYFGSADTTIPAPRKGQSLCKIEYQKIWYYDDSPTIGFLNDTINATGSIHGFVKYADGKPAINIRIIYDDFSHPNFVFTDSSGYYFIKSAYAMYTGLFIGEGNAYSVTYINVSSSVLCYQDINLNWVTGIKNNKNTNHYLLKQNYPNPFNPRTIIAFVIPSDQYVEIKIFDELGNEIESLLNDFVYAGEHKLEFDGSRFASGNYFYRLIAGNHIETKKLVLLK